MSFRKKTPFSYPFSSPIGENQFVRELARVRTIFSVSVYIDDDNAGPILINVHIERQKAKYQLGQPTGIYDGSGPNAKRFEWVGTFPLDWSLPNTIVVDHVNHSGAAINKVILAVVVA